MKAYKNRIIFIKELINQTKMNIIILKNKKIQTKELATKLRTLDVILHYEQMEHVLI